MPLNKTELEKILKESEICYIATTKPNGDPHVVPIWFIWYQSKIYFETDKTTVKFHNLQKRRQMYWEKYPKHMEDSYINEKTLLFEVIPDKEQSWHYGPSWD
jgi:nitroimidazol reductase NimA-like FMN-containing flavoprotein (pyridoxamine 5'-phosphate oxidase superfamily)